MMLKQIPTESLTKLTNEKVVFGFSELRNISYREARNNSAFFIDFIDRLKKYCQLTWNDLRTSQRHGFGTESIPVTKLRERVLAHIPPELIKLLVLRATGNNHVFLGYRDRNIFQVIFVEYQFGDIYDHG